MLRWVVVAVLAVGFEGAAASAIAQNWVRVGGDGETEHYVDDGSLVRDGDVVRATKRAVYREPQPIGGTAGMPLIRESVGIVEDDCKRMQHRVVSIKLISDHDQVMWSSGDMRRVWESIEPGSAGASTLEFVCARTAP
ncbi:MAG: surface-adhesin E family protein [Betaproteobacteria bacterium]